MKFAFKKSGANIIDLLRSAGYSYRGVNNGLPASAPGGSPGGRGDMSFIKRVGVSEYPHYHIYVKVEGEDIILNLHLDQKKPSYQGASAHSGEYNGELVEREMERVKKILTSNLNFGFMI